jgi:hypothetical protein
MIMEAAVDIAIKEVCPIHGVSFGKLDDKKTWRIDFSNEATDEQKIEAQKILDGFNWDDQTKEKYRKYIRNIECKDNLTFKQGFADYLEKIPSASFSDYLDYLESIKTL